MMITFQDRIAWAFKRKDAEERRACRAIKQ